MKIDSLSVFFPAYNEAENIQNTVEKALKILKTLDLKKFEIVIVNDGSKDNTESVAKKLSKQYPQVKVVSQVNGGYGMALRTGFSNCKYDWIVYTDSDGQFDFSEISKFLEKTDNADYLIGYRLKRGDPFYRLITAKLWALSVFILFGIWVKDVDCGFKMVKREILSKIAPLESGRGAMINAELLIKLKKANFRIVQIGVHNYPRLFGNPTGVKFNVILRSYLDLFKLWWKIR